MTTNSITLSYLPLRARGECSRLMLRYRNISFVDNTVYFDEWPKEKASGKICPLGQLPSLILPSGTVLVQSGAIARYIAKLANLIPLNDENLAIADSVFELTQEMNMINPLFNWFPFESEKWKLEKDAYFNNFPMRMKFVQSLLQKSSFVADENPSFADFALFHILDLTQCIEPDSLIAYPEVLAWFSKMKELPNIKEYMENRPNNTTPKWGMQGSFVMSKVAEDKLI